MDKSWKAQEKRIINVFSNIKDISRSDTTTEIYRKYLIENIESPCTLTGIEDFNWEEFYVFGPGDKSEYEKLKRTRPSYTDEFTLIEIERIDEHYGILAKVRRTTDRKVFSLPLADLEAVDKKSKNYILLDDYSVWFCNY